ncbi:MAG: hypothetical protein M5U01_02590 [Ardenticatenaceae bacterium]|nr:hypothetical protein [Ardenticatenaceae bacterium]
MATVVVTKHGLLTATHRFTSEAGDRLAELRWNGPIGTLTIPDTLPSQIGPVVDDPDHFALVREDTAYAEAWLLDAKARSLGPDVLSVNYEGAIFRIASNSSTVADLSLLDEAGREWVRLFFNRTAESRMMLGEDVSLELAAFVFAVVYLLDRRRLEGLLIRGGS